MRNRGTESQSNRDKDDTNDTEDVPPLAACIKTLPEAVRCSLEHGFNKSSLFIFARALMAFGITTKTRIRKEESGNAFSLWWNTAKPILPPDADFDEYRMVFEDAFAKARSPLGANPLQEAVRRA